MTKEEILYQIVAVDSELKKGFPDEITTILKNGITGKTYTDYDFKNHRYLYCFINDNFNIYDRLEEKDKEIERLNNIIDELEKDLWKVRQLIFTKYNSNEWNNCLSFNDDILPIINKLKELKNK